MGRVFGVDVELFTPMVGNQQRTLLFRFIPACTVISIARESIMVSLAPVVTVEWGQA